MLVRKDRERGVGALGCCLGGRSEGVHSLGPLQREGAPQRRAGYVQNTRWRKVSMCDHGDVLFGACLHREKRERHPVYLSFSPRKPMYTGMGRKL